MLSRVDAVSPKMLNEFSMEDIEHMERLVGSPTEQESNHYDSGKLLHKKVRSHSKKNKQEEMRNSSYEPNV